MLALLKLAGKIAIPSNKKDTRNFWLGSIGIRSDGVLVSSKNGSVICSEVDDYKVIPESHAETRLCRKLGKNGIIYVSRISRRDFNFAMARPCIHCQQIIRAHKVKKVYYTINESQYGIWDPVNDTDKVYEK